jgi:thiamine-phosphate pyrophosphorylase
MSDNQPEAIYRILDASSNRAAEGMRTLEEFARFVLNDATQSGQWKSLRHDLSSVLGNFSREKLLQARDTQGDVGTEIQHACEYRRDSLASVIAAAASRTQQSLRTLEEYGKTIDSKSAAEFERIRYRTYTLAANLELTIGAKQRQDRLKESTLYALIDCDSDQESFALRIAQLADAGVDLFQLRDSDADDLTLLNRARIGSETAERHGGLFIVNDRPDIAVVAEADGVHVGQDELPVAETRQIVGPNRLIGVSTHSIQQARRAVTDGADYIGCGPTFPGRTKTFESFPGTDLLVQIAAEIQIPAFAIGGIDSTNVDQVVRTGAKRIAVTGAIRDADDPLSAVIELKSSLASQ